MKKIGEYTARGTVAHQVTQQISLFDGRFDTGYRVVAFEVGPQQITGNHEVAGTLYMDSDGAGNNDWDWSDNIQIAWSGCTNDNDGMRGPAYTVVDEDNLIVEDLFIRGHSSDGSFAINYIIKFEKYEFSEWRGALAMVRSKSQNVGS